MKTQLACALVIASAVVGCAQQPKTVWLRTDGRVAANDPVMSRQFEVDRTVCSGDTGKAGLTALNPGTSDRYNGAVAVERGALSNNVMRGCMAEKGYVLVREERWSRLSEQIFRIDKWSLCRGQAAKRSGSGVK
jgi:hypothetical protein